MVPGNHLLDGGPDSPMGRGNFQGEKGLLIVSMGKLCTHQCKNGRTDRYTISVVGSGGPKESHVSSWSRGITSFVNYSN